MLYASEHPVVRLKVAELRDAQTRPPRFRELVREISLLLGYEALRSLPIEPSTVRTPLADAPGYQLSISVGLVPVLRAGLGMVDAFLTLVPFRLIWGFIGGSTARFSFTGADRHVDTMEGALSPAGPIALIGAVAVAGGMARWVSEGLGL